MPKEFGRNRRVAQLLKKELSILIHEKFTLKEYGLIVGLFYSAKRILLCHPFGGHGYDPVPKKFTKDS